MTLPARFGLRTNPDWTRDGLMVSARPNVRQKDYRPWDASNWGKPTPDTDWDWHDRTYTWHCRCGESHTRRHERISEAWNAHRPALGVVIVVLGRDV